MDSDPGDIDRADHGDRLATSSGVREAAGTGWFGGTHPGRGDGAARTHGTGDRLDRSGGGAHLRGAALHDEAARGTHGTPARARRHTAGQLSARDVTRRVRET